MEGRRSSQLTWEVITFWHLPLVIDAADHPSALSLAASLSASVFIIRWGGARGGVGTWERQVVLFSRPCWG